MRRPREEKVVIRKVARPRQANCDNCEHRMTTGMGKCPVHGVAVTAENICDDYKPGLR